MFSRLRKWIGGDPVAANDQQGAETTVVYLRLPASPVNDSHAVESTIPDRVSAGRESINSTDGETAAAIRTSRSSSRRRTPRATAVRFARRFSEMTPREAFCLMAIHRRVPGGLAKESPALLKRDLERFLWSTCGQRHVGRIPTPDVARVRRWIEEAQQGR